MHWAAAIPVVTPRTEISAGEGAARMFVFEAGVDLDQLVQRREPGGRRAQRPGGDSRRPEGSRRTARGVDGHVAMAIEGLNNSFYADPAGLDGLKRERGQAVARRHCARPRASSKACSPTCC